MREIKEVKSGDRANRRISKQNLYYSYEKCKDNKAKKAMDILKAPIKNPNA